MKFHVDVNETDFNPIDLTLRIESKDELEEMLVRFNLPRSMINPSSGGYTKISASNVHNFSDLFNNLANIYDNLD